MIGEKYHNKIKIHCITNKCGPSQFCVSVSNSKRQVVYENKTSKNGILEFEVTDCDEYQIRVRAEKSLNPEVAYKWIRLHPYMNGSVYFVFDTRDYPHCIPKSTFFLRDKNYEGLPIEKGEIYLWQVRM